MGLRIRALFLSCVMAVSAAFADNGPAMSFPEKAQEFLVNTSSDGGASIKLEMTAFEMPAEYDCPLFSNSPYTEVLSALDKMQDNLNTVFPQCKAANENVTLQASQLRQRISDAQNMQKTGQTHKLSMSVDSIVELTQKMQQSLATMAGAQTKVCYGSNQQFRSAIYSMNDAFQSIAPVVLDLASKNPAIAKSLGPALKILTGADNISKGISFIEQIEKDSIMFDMTDKNTRVNTIKNVCQFMKLYRRLEYMRLSRADQVQTVHTEFQQKISTMNQKLEKFKRDNGLVQSTVSSQKGRQDTSLGGTQATSNDPVHNLFESLKSNLPAESEKVQKALAEIEQAKGQYNNPTIPQCQAILTVRGSKTLAQFRTDLIDFNRGYESASEFTTLLKNLNAFEREFVRSQQETDNEKCVSIGQDWLSVMNQMLSFARKRIAQYEIRLAELNGADKMLPLQNKAEKMAQEVKNENENNEKLKIMMQYAAFESSEVEKRAKDMHRYFFRGPYLSEVKAACDETSEQDSAEVKNEKKSKCTTGAVKAVYQWWRNDGPIYELLNNNEKHFDYAYTNMRIGIGRIQAFEKRFVLREFNGLVPQRYDNVERYNLKLDDYTMNLPHIKPEFLVRGTSDHRMVCEGANLALSYYIVATEHLMSTEAMCNMIYPALKEAQVAPYLKAYCQPTRSVLGSEQPAKLHELWFKLIGRTSEKSELARASGQVFEQSPLAFVANLRKKVKDLKCEQTSSF